MRTSNKLLLGIIIGPLIIFTLMQLTLYAKYKAGNYVSLKSVERERFKKALLQNITHIAVYGVNNFRIVPADTGKLELENDRDSWIRYHIAGDSLVIHGDSTITRSGGTSYIERSSETVTLYLPVSATIHAENSEVNLYGTEDSTKARSYIFTLSTASTLKIDRNGPDNSKQVYFRNLFVDADHAPSIELTEASQIAELQLKTLESGFTDNGAVIGKLTIDADNLSSITLKGDNLKKLSAGRQ